MYQYFQAADVEAIVDAAGQQHQGVQSAGILHELRDDLGPAADAHSAAAHSAAALPARDEGGTKAVGTSGTGHDFELMRRNQGLDERPDGRTVAQVAEADGRSVDRALSLFRNWPTR